MGFRIEPKDIIIPDMYVWGLWLGYPDCCAQSFRVRHDGRSYPGDASFPGKGTGFVPCPACAATKTQEELYAEIAANRVCRIPFPNQPEEEFPEYTPQFALEILIARKLISA